jgi:hypothetical protein
MHTGLRSLPACVCLVAASLAGCGGFGVSSSTNGSTGTLNPGSGGTGASGSGGGSGAGGGTGSGSGNPTTGFGSQGTITGDDAVVAIASVAGPVVVAVGANQTLSVTFNSNDGLQVTGFAVPGSLGSLPPGWSGPASFTCASVTRGANCVLDLSYAPTATGSGTVTLNYEFVDNANIPRTGYSISIPYAAITANTVQATASVTGEVDAVQGGGPRSLAVTFTTDDGNAATGLAVTADLANLPDGWSTTAASFTCPIVSLGSGCQLPLSFAPTAPVHGILTVPYAYTDDAGAARTGAVNIPYATQTSGVVVAMTAPSGQVTAIQKTGGQSVAVTFTTNDGAAAGSLALTSNLSALPAGWSGPTTGFSCASVGTGNGCQLHLTYAPTTLGSGTLPLSYSYIDAAGQANEGLLNVAYVATTDDNVVGTAAPSGPIDAIVGQGGQTVAVTFSTDDGQPATALQIISGLAALPAGWSGGGSFACSGVDAANACQLTLAYTPAAAAAGVLNLGYRYLNNAGVAKTGTVGIPYVATTDDNVVAAPSPAMLAVAKGSSTPVTVTFTTDDGNLASGLSLTTNLATLPSGWTSPTPSFACASLSTGSSCRLALVYAPTADGAGTLTLGYAYTNDSGTVKTGSTSIAYSATGP